MIDRRQFSVGATALWAAASARAETAPAPGLWSRSEGSGRDIVFVHGWSMDHRDEIRIYEPIFARRTGWRRHYVDLPGMGRSPADPRIRDLDDMLDGLARWIRHRIGDGPAILAGTSAGAYLALGALARPDIRVDGLLLRAPLIVPDNERRDVDPPAPIITDAAVRETIAPAEREAMGELMIQTLAYLEAMRAKMREAVTPAMAAANQAFLTSIRGDPSRYRLRALAGSLPGFERPALIVTGRLDASVGYRDAWRLMPGFPRATFVTLDRAEHGVPIDQQQVFAALVDDWLDRLEEDRAARERGAT
ncbi:alpha/beta hydrolase [Sphingosinicella sp. LHD-64]|uniref:alpha/beta fold hydrolase n=1 Tax=Sphingosinicella sp. LHD-64 TaxID=3072139 RepID=UPI00280D3F9E|nr:alpha/beta hydrolase [Sphingosinicella sp. LHD-64]MDQ8756843.1 alpha/beta hydrolase [Sphingosinicella sp. LHD-64]